MENPAQGEVSDCRSGKLDNPDDTRTLTNTQAAGRAIGSALVCLPDRLSPGRHAADLAVILRRRLDADARLWLAGAACLALDPDALDTLTTAAQRDLEPPQPCFGRRHRSPLLTPVEKRRAAQIPDFDDPDFLAKLGAGTTDRDRRARLASAWNGATDRDRRDLMARVTGRVGA